MYRLLMAAAAVLSVVQTASGADLPLKAAPAPVVVAPNWTGFYIGINAGYAWGYDTGDNTFGPTALGFATGPCTAGCSFSQAVPLNSFAGGGQAGYNFQAGKWVLGVEADFQGRNSSNSTTVVFNAFPDNQIFTDKQTWFGTFRGRVGTTALSPAVLLYLTGGLAYGHLEHTVTQNFAEGLPVVFTPRVLSDSATKVGWVVGGGVEYKLAAHWSIGTEYLYIQFASDTLTAPGAPSVAVPPAAFPVTSITFKDHSQVARVKLNYTF